MRTTLLTFLLISNMAFAGGVRCKECPSESNACMPLPGCNTVAEDIFGLAPHCAPSMKFRICEEQCTVFSVDQNPLIDQACVDLCFKQPCR